MEAMFIRVCKVVCVLVGLGVESGRSSCFALLWCYRVSGVEEVVAKKMDVEQPEGSHRGAQ